MNNKTSQNPVMILDLCQYSQQIAKPIFTVKMLGNKRSYEELDLFRQQVEIERSHPLPYSSCKRKVLTYKSIFLSLSILFFFLGFVILTQTRSWHFSDAYFMAAKSFVSSFCGMAGLAALWIAKSLRTEKDAAHRSLRSARYKLSKAFARKRIEFGLKGFFAFGKAYDKAQILQHAYRDAQDKFLDRQLHLEHLFDQISSASLPAKERERLYNQALLEFNDQLEHTLENFRGIKVAN